MEEVKNFAVGDIVRVGRSYPDPMEGEVTEVEEEGYVSVRVTSGTVFAFWSSELEMTGRKLDPQALPMVQYLDSAIRDAETSVGNLKAMRSILSNMTVDK